MATPDPRNLRVQFIHGLEGNPQGTKAVFLAARFDAVTPAMDTSHFAGAVETQLEAIEARRPDLIVGSSFGGAIAVSLLARGVWSGPTVLLAAAAARLKIPNALPTGVAVTVVHGTRDDVIAPDDSRVLATTGTPALVRLVLVDDDHRLQTLVDSGRLASLVLETWERARTSGQPPTPKRNG